MDVSPALRSTTRRLVSSIARRETTSYTFEVFGCHALADHADRLRTRGDLAAITLPLDRHAVRYRRIKLLRRSGGDQAAVAMADRGWLGYEAPLPDILLAAVRSFPGAFLDVGANTGLYSLIAATARPGVPVHAFEALPEVAAMCAENLSINHLATRVMLHRVAVAEKTGTLVLHVPVPSGNFVETSASLDPSFKEDIGMTIEVPTTSLDDHWQAEGRLPVGVIKIDTEGTEHNVLSGARQMIQSDRPIVFFEFLPRGESAFLDEFGASLGLVDVRLSPWEAVVGDSVLFHEAAWNHAFVPVEKLESFISILHRTKLQVTRAEQ